MFRVFIRTSSHKHSWLIDSINMIDLFISWMLTSVFRSTDTHDPKPSTQNHLVGPSSRASSHHKTWVLPASTQNRALPVPYDVDSSQKLRTKARPLFGPDQFLNTYPPTGSWPRILLKCLGLEVKVRNKYIKAPLLGSMPLGFLEFQGELVVF